MFANKRAKREVPTSSPERTSAASTHGGDGGASKQAQSATPATASAAIAQRYTLEEISAILNSQGVALPVSVPQQQSLSVESGSKSQSSASTAESATEDPKEQLVINKGAINNIAEHAAFVGHKTTTCIGYATDENEWTDIYTNTRTNAENNQKEGVFRLSKNKTTDQLKQIARPGVAFCFDTNKLKQAGAEIITTELFGWHPKSKMTQKFQAGKIPKVVAVRQQSRLLFMPIAYVGLELMSSKGERFTTFEKNKAKNDLNYLDINNGNTGAPGGKIDALETTDSARCREAAEEIFGKGCAHQMVIDKGDHFLIQAPATSSSSSAMKSLSPVTARKQGGFSYFFPEHTQHEYFASEDVTAMITSGNHLQLQVQPQADTFSLAHAKLLARSSSLAGGEFHAFLDGLSDTAGNWVPLTTMHFNHIPAINGDTSHQIPKPQHTRNGMRSRNIMQHFALHGCIPQTFPDENFRLAVATYRRAFQLSAQATASSRHGIFSEANDRSSAQADQVNHRSNASTLAAKGR